MQLRLPITVLGAALIVGSAQAQCPQLYDYNGVPSSAPYWYSCSGANFTLLIASPSSIAAFTIDWGDGSAQYNGASLAPPGSVSHVYTSTVDTFVVVFTEILTGCTVQGVVVMEESSSASIQIPIGGLTQVCAPQAVEFINSSTNVSPNTVFTWDFGDGSPLEVYDYTNLGVVLSHTYLPGTVSCETTVRLEAENYCNTLQGGPSFATFNPIRVWDLDSARITPSATLLCYPDTIVTFLNTTQRNCLMQGNIYQRFEYWNFGDYWGQGQDSIIDWNPWPPTFPRTIAYPGVGTYQVMMLDSNYCGIDTAYITIQIVPPPSVTLTSNPDTICAGGTVFFTQTNSGGANFHEWDFGDGGGWQNTGAGNQAHTYITAGNYTTSYAASIQGATAGCADTASVPIVVLPAPTALFSVDNTAACNSLTVTFTNTSISAVSQVWDFGDGTFDNSVTPPPHTYGAVGDYTITLTCTNADGCTNAMSIIVHVYAPPVIGIGAQNVCVGEVAMFADNSVTATGNPVIDWDWDFGDGAIDSVQNPSHLYASAGNYSVTLTATTPYCGNTGTQMVTVEAKPTATFIPSAVLGCSPMQVSMANTSSGAVNYAWDFGDGALDTTFAPAHTYLNTGTADTVYTVTLIASTTFGCSDTVSVPVTVAPAAVAQFAHNGLPGCAPTDVDFTNLSTGANAYVWDFGDGTPTTNATDPSHQYVNNTFFLAVNTVTLIASSPAGCSDTATASILVYPTADFSFVSLPDSGCSPLTVTFPAVVGAVSYDWDFGDGTTGQGPAPAHTYLNGGTTDLQYTATLVAANAFGCADTAFSTITVFGAPVAQLLVADVDGCHAFTTTLQNLSTGADSYSWDYGDGNTSDTATAVHDYTWYNYAGPGAANFTVTLTASRNNGCSSTASAQVQVFPAVTAAFVNDSIGCSPFDADFVNVSQNAVSYFWAFGDGTFSTLPNPAHTYVNQSLADVVFTPMLVATSAFGCSDTAFSTVTVHPAPIAQFVPSTIAGCGPLGVTFNDLTIGSVNNAWAFGDLTFLNQGPGNVQHTYSNQGAGLTTYDVVMVASTALGCTDTATTQLQLYPDIIASFNTPASGCSPMVLSINNTSIGAVGYVWNMGDGTILTGATPTYTYVNSTTADQQWTITLIASSAFGCSDTVSQVVVVHPAPSAAFVASPSTQQFPASTVSFANTSSAGTWNYVWTYGDGAGSAVQFPPDHTYGTWGQFTVMLVVSSAFCSDTAAQLVEVTPPEPTASFTGGGEGCAPLTVSFTNTSLQGVSYQWNFGDGGTSAAENPVYTYNLPGTYTVSMTAFGVGGTVNTVTQQDIVVVHPRAQAFFVIQPDQVVVPNQPVFTYNLSGNADTYWWDFGDGATSTETDPSHLYTYPDTFDVTLVANNQWNCPDTFLLAAAVIGIANGDLSFPNAFTPGSGGPTDGIYDPQSFNNDFFFPIHEGVESYRLQVFNRWGELVFETTDVAKGWDGWYRDKPAKQDVYAWKAFARFSDGRETVQSGDVTLIR
ncbi:MAG: PKD domain-containing protein [Flavobacteriales bacterium]